MKKFTSPSTEIEESFWQAGRHVAGVDEVGRGCLAGPVVAAAVILPMWSERIAGVADSKTIKENQRGELATMIRTTALTYSIAFISNEVVDRINILQATFQAMHKSIGQLGQTPEHLLIDGNQFKDQGIPYTTIISGDALCYSIACASIIAKVARDEWMKSVADAQFPEYGFAKHKGYATAFHRRAIVEFGPCSIHRTTFLRKLMQETGNIYS